MPDIGARTNPKGNKAEAFGSSRLHHSAAGGQGIVHHRIANRLARLGGPQHRHIDHAEYAECEYEFKKLLEHHDLRARNFLYPLLDRCTTPEERQELLSRMRQTT